MLYNLKKIFKAVIPLDFIEGIYFKDLNWYFPQTANQHSKGLLLLLLSLNNNCIEI